MATLTVTDNELHDLYESVVTQRDSLSEEYMDDTDDDGQFVSPVAQALYDRYSDLMAKLLAAQGR